MNLQMVAWFAGVMATIYGFKFVLAVFKRLGSKSTMNDIMDRAEDKMNDAAEKVAGMWKQQKTRRKEKKAEAERPIVTIR